MEGNLASYTISKNKAAIAGGIGVFASELPPYTDATSNFYSRNDIVFGNSKIDGHVETTGSGPVALLQREDGIVGLSSTVGTGATLDDINMSDYDPQLVKPGKDFHLRPGSPAIDAIPCDHAPITDFDGDARPIGAMCDIGADEAS